MHAVTGAAVLLVLLGVVSAAYPRLWWELTSWQYRRPEAVEPSDTAYTVNRVVGVGLIGFGLLLGLTAEAGRRADRRREEATRRPEAVVRRYADVVMNEARRSGAAPRQLTTATLTSLAGKVEYLWAEPAVSFALTGAVTVTVDTGDTIFSARKFCLVLPTEEHMRVTVSPGSCPLPVDDQQSQVVGVAETIMSRARERNASPRDEALLRDVARDQPPGRYAVVRSDAVDIEFAPDFPSGPRDVWCVLLPERLDDAPQVVEGSCPGRSTTASSAPARP